MARGSLKRSEQFTDDPVWAAALAKHTHFLEARVFLRKSRMPNGFGQEKARL